MNVNAAMDLLSRADPCTQASATVGCSPKTRSSAPKRLLAIVVASVLLGGGGVVAAQAVITAQQPTPVTTWEHRSPTELSASPDDYTDVHRPEISSIIAGMASVYPLPPTATSDEVFAPLRATFPSKAGDVLPTSATDRRAKPYFGGISNMPVDDDHIQQPQELSVAGLSGTVALLAVNSWYEYWLQATPTQRTQAQPVLDSFQTWADLAYRLGSTDVAEPGRILLIARNAEAAANGNAGPIRSWLTDQLWIDPSLL